MRNILQSIQAEETCCLNIERTNLSKQKTQLSVLLAYVPRLIHKYRLPETEVLAAILSNFSLTTTACLCATTASVAPQWWSAAAAAGSAHLRQCVSADGGRRGADRRSAPPQPQLGTSHTSCGDLRVCLLAGTTSDGGGAAGWNDGSGGTSENRTSVSGRQQSAV